jgi:hypothetical protein
MLRSFARFGLATLVLALAGCGSTELVRIDQGGLGKAVVGLDDLPPRAEFTEDGPEPCGPIPIIEQRASEAAVTKMFRVGSTRLKEAVGAFETGEQSTAAFDELVSSERGECIRESIERLSGSKVESEPLESLGLTDSESLARYTVTEPEEENVEQAIDIAAAKFDLCVAAIIIFQEDGSAESARRLFDAAVQPAAATCQ